MTVPEPSLPAAERRQPRRRRWLAITAVGTWIVILLVGLVEAAWIQSMDDLGCSATPGDSDFGTFRWSVLPPGPTCTYTREANGFAQVDGPTPVMSVWLVVLAVGAIVCIALIRRSRRP